MPVTPTPAAPCAVVVSLHVLPEHVDEFVALLTGVLDAMRHERTFVNAVVHRDPADPTRFMIYETWADRDDLQRVQLHRRYRKAYTDRLPQLLRQARTFEVWDIARSDFTFFAAT
ncbi:MAG: putative quinol monooxygenase [Alphaproteobacteria bacterium]